MEPLIIMEVDGPFSEYGQVLIATDKEKINRNLSKMPPIEEYIQSERKKRRPLILAIGSICDYIVFYEESNDGVVRMSFMPFYTPQEFKLDILHDDCLVKYFNQLAEDIRPDNISFYDLEFVAPYGAIPRLWPCQLN